MEKQLNRVIELYGSKYVITGFDSFEKKYPAMAKCAEETGKYPAYFFCNKILKNGNLSENQTKALFIFKNGNYIVL